MAGNQRRALEGVRILDFTWVVAGPVATRILADQGAEVIKIERRDSLDLGTRRGGFTGNLFRGKESTVINMADPRGREMLRAIINYGTALSVDVIAEGIETVAQLQAVQVLGCRYAQGFLLGRPQPISGIVRNLRRAAA